MSGDDLTATEAAQKEYYNRIAQEYDRHYANPHALRYRYELYDEALRGVDLRNMHVLDAMCGGGEASGFFLRKGAVPTGLDISDECCKIYAERFPDSRVVCCSILKTEFPDASFDVVLTDSLHHLHPYVDKALDEILRILKPGGYFCCWEPSAGSLLDWVRKVWYRVDRKYFEKNEESIDPRSLFGSRMSQFELLKTRYGGSVAYVFVNLSMALRIPTKLVNVYAPACIAVEHLLNCFQVRLFSCWVLCLLRKGTGSRLLA